MMFTLGFLCALALGYLAGLLTLPVVAAIAEYRERTIETPEDWGEGNGR